jgi:hypothetical protein
MKWIKASERMPTKPGTYFIKDMRWGKEGDKKVSQYYCSGRSNSLFFRRREDIIWLDEGNKSKKKNPTIHTNGNQ